MDADIQMAMMSEQTELLKKILEKLREICGRIAEDGDVVIDQNSSLNAKLTDITAEVKQLSRVIEDRS